MSKSDVLRLTRLGLVLAGLGLAAACATRPGEEDEYKRSVVGPALQVPSDLVLPPGDPAMDIPAPIQTPAK